MAANAVSGSPFKFNVLDIRKVKTRGEGLTMVECNQLATFILLAPEAQLEDIDVLITGMIYSKHVWCYLTDWCGRNDSIILSAGKQYFAVY